MCRPINNQAYVQPSSKVIVYWTSFIYGQLSTDRVPWIPRCQNNLKTKSSYRYLHCLNIRNMMSTFNPVKTYVPAMNKKPGLETISRLDNAAKEGSCVTVFQFCVVMTATTNQRPGKDRVNQLAARKLPCGWLTWWKSYSRCLSVIKLVRWHALSDRTLCFVCFSSIPLLLKILTNQQLRKVWDNVTNLHVLSMTAGRRFLFCLWAETRRLWFLQC